MNHTAKPCKTAANHAPTLSKTTGVSVANAVDTPMNHVITTDDATELESVVTAMRDGGATFETMVLTYDRLAADETTVYEPEHGITQLFGFVTVMTERPSETYDNISLKVEA